MSDTGRSQPAERAASEGTLHSHCIPQPTIVSLNLAKAHNVASSVNRYFSGLQIRVVATALILLCHPARSCATLYVILLDSRQIAIASDSRLVTVSPDHGLQTRDGADKVIFLGPRLVFMSAGRPK